jgi:hypothetical protein
MSAILAPSTVVLVVNLLWFHYTRFTDTSMHKSHWFGLITANVDLKRLTGVILQHQAGLDWPFASITFTWDDGEMSIRLPTYGHRWIKPVVTHLISAGVTIDQSLLEAIESGRYDPPVFSRPA